MASAGSLSDVDSFGDHDLLEDDEDAVGHQLPGLGGGGGDGLGLHGDGLGLHGDGLGLHGGGLGLHGGGLGLQLRNGDYMDTSDLLKCLGELDNSAQLPGGPQWRPVPEAPRLLRPPHCRREAVVCVVSLRTASTFCYAVISRLGRVGVYDAGLALLDSYTLELGYVHPHAKIGIGREGDLREPRQHTTWVNDAVFLADVQMLVVAASDRSLTFLDASRLLHCRRNEVRSLPASPRCLAYAAATASAPESRLFIGDDVGAITTLTFRNPRRALLRPPDAENKSTSFFWPELRQQAAWVAVHQDAGVHADAVARLWYEAHNGTLVSCSRDPQRTVVVRHLSRRREPYVFCLPRGASCFVLDRPLQLLVTAGRDALVRLWNPLVPSQPQAVLAGHKHPVLDVAVLSRSQLVVSMDLRGTLKIWHAAEHSLLQTLALAFSCLQVPGRRIEHGARALYPGPPVKAVSEDGEVLIAALCGELVTVRLVPPPRGAFASTAVRRASVISGASSASVALAPPRRDQSPAVPESWSPSLLSASSSSGRDGRPRGPRRGSVASVHDAEVPAEDADEDEEGDEDEDAADVRCGALPASSSPLPDAIEDWPLPDDRLFKEEEPQMLGRPAKAATQAAAPGTAAPPEPVSHRPLPDENGLYPEEVASLRALGLRPLDLEAIGVNLSSAATPGGGGPLALLPMDALAAVRQAHAAQKKTHKQMRTLAWHCAPHLALKLPEEAPLAFSRTLPVSSRMRARGLDVSDPARLAQAKLARLGAAARRRASPRTSPRTSPHPTASSSSHTAAAAGRVGSASSGRRSRRSSVGDRTSGLASCLNT